MTEKPIWMSAQEWQDLVESKTKIPVECDIYFTEEELDGEIEAEAFDRSAQMYMGVAK